MKTRAGSRTALALGLALVAFPPGPARAADGPADQAVLHLEGMTLVARQGESGELRLRSRTAVYHPSTERAELEEVDAVFVDAERSRRFEMRCDRAELDLETHDFVARGNVHGVTADGQRYRTPAVRYEHAPGLLHSDEPVSLTDATGSFHGDGFHYDLAAGRLRLLGNVVVLQAP